MTYIPKMIWEKWFKKCQKKEKLYVCNIQIDENRKNDKVNTANVK